MHDIVYDRFWDSQWALVEMWEKQVPARVTAGEYPDLCFQPMWHCTSARTVRRWTVCDARWSVGLIRVECLYAHLVALVSR